MFRKITGTAIVHGLASGAALALYFFAHFSSKFRIWEIFPGSYKIRQLSIYLLDMLPFYLVALLLVCAIFFIRLRGREVGILRFLLAAVAAIPVSALLHQPFFPTDPRGLLVGVVFALIYASVYPFFYYLLALVKFSNPPTGVFPAVASPFKGLLLGTGIVAFYIAMFNIFGRNLTVEERYDAARMPTAKEATYSADNPDKTTQRNGSEVPSSARMRTDLFSIEELDLRTTVQSIIDIDGNGYYDLVGFDESREIGLWLNKKGVLIKKANFLDVLKSDTLGSFNFSDLDRDGRLDLVVANFGPNPESAFENGYLKKLFWYPVSKPAIKGQVFRQINLDNWKNVTAKLFPDGAPQMYRKLEPLLFFDANSDGRLDIIWSGYPHPRYSENKLYVENADGTFSDQALNLLNWSPGAVYSEGSDIGDFDGDGDIDLFAYGFLFRNEDGKFRQVCGDQLPEIVCDMPTRIDEGGLLEDVNGDGIMDFILNYHGVGVHMPKFYLQLFLGTGERARPFKRVVESERHFYGFNTYLRAKDFDFNGRGDILTAQPGRLLSFHQGKLMDLLPAISGSASGTIYPLGWIDIDEDGDWDFLARRLSDAKTLLFRNNLNPARFIKLAARGEGNVENQFGTTFEIEYSDGRRLVKSYRQDAGYGGSADPRIILPAPVSGNIRIRTCFASLKSAPKGSVSVGGARLSVSQSEARCVRYALELPSELERINLTLIAGTEIAVIKLEEIAAK